MKTVILRKVPKGTPLHHDEYLMKKSTNIFWTILIHVGVHVVVNVKIENFHFFLTRNVKIHQTQAR